MSASNFTNDNTAKVYAMHDAGNSNFNNRYIILISTAAALGGLLFGFDTAIISGAIAAVEKHFVLNDVWLGFAVSSILIGCGIGAAITGWLCDQLGRKKVLFICGVLFAVTGIGTGMANSLTVFLLFRICGGFAVGAAAMASPMYIAETVPAHQRGRMVAVYQLAIVAGILLAYFSNWLLSSNTVNGWRWMFASQAVPSVLFLISLLLVPESPRWLIGQNNITAAKKIVEQIGGKLYASTAIQAIQQSFATQQKQQWQHLLLPKYRKVLWLGIFIAIFQQVTGINAILYYAPEIFKQTGVDSGNALLQTIGIGVAMLLFTFIAIGFVDKTGRRPLLFWGSAVMGMALCGVALCFHYNYFQNYLVLILIVLYIAGFSASLGAVTWVVLSEIFPNSIRAMALSLSTLILWLADFAASFFFPIANKRLGPTTTLLIFAALCFVYVVYIKIKVPETKGKTLEELEQQLTS
jgi:MFS transporter, SP family, arabinose:H+ symporter